MIGNKKNFHNNFFEYHLFIFSKTMLIIAIIELMVQEKVKTSQSFKKNVILPACMRLWEYLFASTLQENCFRVKTKRTTRLYSWLRLLTMFHVLGIILCDCKYFLERKQFSLLFNDVFRMSEKFFFWSKCETCKWIKKWWWWGLIFSKNSI